MASSSSGNSTGREGNQRATTNKPVKQAIVYAVVSSPVSVKTG